VSHINPLLAAELVHKRVDVILAVGPEAVVDTARATRTIPIVFRGVGATVKQGLVASCARPGRNATAVVWNAGHEMIAKLLQILRQISSHAAWAAYFSFCTTLRTVEGGALSRIDPENPPWCAAAQSSCRTADRLSSGRG
jgi:hypothetical protein